jgi:PAS domain S-box-containing protein
VASHPRVVVVDDSAETRAQLRALLESTGSFEVVGEALPGPEASAVLEVTAPDLVVGTMQAVRNNDRRLRALVESVVDYAILMLDGDGYIRSWNSGAERITGYRAQEILGRHFSIFTTGDDRGGTRPMEPLARAEREGRYEEEDWRVTKDGSRFWANVVITAIHGDDGALVGFAKVMRDFGERQSLLEALEAHANELREANAALAAVAKDRTEFLAVTAHELRTPVTVVDGFASMLRDQWDTFSEADRLDMVHALARGGARLSALVDELLTASRLEAGVLSVEPVDFDLSEVVAEVVRDVAGSSPSLVVNELGSAPVHADRGRVHQMVTNYVTNALRYGGPPIVITSTRTPEGVVLRVDDSGSGVPPEMVPRLFGKFARGSVHQGTGLGLFIVRELARAQGGDAWYEASDGGGSSFALRLPSARQE